MNAPAKTCPAPLAYRIQCLTRAQIAAARARVFLGPKGYSYWTPDNSAPMYRTKQEADDASIQEWRDNL